MSNFKFILPHATQNYCLNPSGEIAGNFAAAAGTTVTRVTTYQKYGLYSYRVQANANNEGIELTLSALSNADHYVTLLARGDFLASWYWSLDGAAFHAPTTIMALDANWSLYGYAFPAAEANGSTTLYVYQNGAGGLDIYLDGIQVEEGTHWTTFCDGDREDCQWSGTAHASYSTRSALTRAGGQLMDFDTDYSLQAGYASGMGTPEQEMGIDEYALLPGGELNSIKVKYREFTLGGTIIGTNWATYHALRQALILALMPDSYPQNDFGYQPVRIWYTGAVVVKEVKAHYSSGLEQKLEAKDPCYFEPVNIRFVADDPYWYEIGNSAVLLDSNDSATLNYIAGRLTSTNQWDDLATGLDNSLNASNETLSVAPNGDLYACGNFHNAGGVAAEHVARYTPSTDTWSALGAGVDAAAVAGAFAPNGDWYVGGAFHNAGGGAAAHIAKYTPSTGAWAALGVGVDDAVYTVTIAPNDDLYVGGAFHNAGGAGALHIARYTPSTGAWAALGAGVDNVVYNMAFAPNGDLYVVGAFHNAGGAGALHIAKYTPSTGAWTALGSGLDDVGNVLLFDTNGDLYIGGTFTAAGGTATSDGICLYKPGSGIFYDVGAGVSGGVAAIYGLTFDDNHILYLVGIFTSAGDIDITDRIAAWNGSTFSALDIDIPGAATCYSVKFSSNSGLYIGFDTTGTGYFSGKATATNSGTLIAFPTIKFYRSGGTTATCILLKNETIDKTIVFNYSLLDGETLTLDIDPKAQAITSSFFGSVPDAILLNSDFGDFYLNIGDNVINNFITVTGAPTITAWMQWRASYRSFD